jgi:hypothetical protein
MVCMSCDDARGCTDSDTEGSAQFVTYPAKPTQREKVACFGLVLPPLHLERLGFDMFLPSMASCPAVTSSCYDAYPVGGPQKQRMDGGQKQWNGNFYRLGLASWVGCRSATPARGHPQRYRTVRVAPRALQGATPSDIGRDEALCFHPLRGRSRAGRYLSTFTSTALTGLQFSTHFRMHMPWFCRMFACCLRVVLN